MPFSQPEIEPLFFQTEEDLRSWFEDHHEQEKEVWIGFYKKGTGIPTVTYFQAVDQALCFGWIDGIRKSFSTEAYMNRFTPRKTDSHWSDVNIKKVKDLKALGLMSQKGLLAFKKRKKDNSRRAAHEQKGPISLSSEYKQVFQRNVEAWDYYESMPSGKKKFSTWWVISAKKEETRKRRLRVLIDSCSQGIPIPPLR